MSNWLVSGSEAGAPKVGLGNRLDGTAADVRESNNGWRSLRAVAENLKFSSDEPTRLAMGKSKY